MSPLTGTSIPLLILAGGLGTRLRALNPELPKPMIPVHGKPFLHWQIEFYYKLGYLEFHLSAGFKADVIEDYPWKKYFPQGAFHIHTEKEPLGTGGAVLEIFRKLPKLAETWVINGDTFLPAALESPTHTPQFEVVYSVLKPDEVFDATPNLVVRDRTVVAIDASRGNYFDAGAVYIDRSAIERYKGPEKCSFHELVLPSLEFEKVGVSVVEGTCYDIGTPERYKRFENYLRRHDDAT